MLEEKRFMMVFLGLFTVTCLILGSFAILEKSARAEEKTIRIGTLTAVTGPYASYGAHIQAGAKVARDEINAAGGILGKKIELIIEDSESKPSVGVSMATRLITRDKVKLIMGTVSSELTLAVMDVAAKYKVPLFSNAATSAALGQKFASDSVRYRFYWKPVPPADMHAKGIVDFMNYAIWKKKLYQTTNKSVVVLRDNTSWSDTQVGSVLDNYLKKSPLWNEGWRITHRETVPRAETDYLATVSKTKALNPGILVTSQSSIAANVAFVKQAIEGGIKCPIWVIYIPQHPEWLRTGGSVVEDVLWLTGIGIIPDEMGHGFIKKIRGLGHGDYGEDVNTAVAYNVLYLAKNTWEKVGSFDDVEKFREEMNKVRHRAPMGVISWNPKTHETINAPEYIPTLIYQIRDGKNVIVWPENYATAAFRLPYWIK